MDKTSMKINPRSEHELYPISKEVYEKLVGGITDMSHSKESWAKDVMFYTVTNQAEDRHGNTLRYLHVVGIDKMTYLDSTVLWGRVV